MNKEIKEYEFMGYDAERSLDEYKNLVEKYLLDFLPTIDTKSFTLREAMEYSLKAKGKRLRPSLLLAACEFAGGDINFAMPYAIAIEYIHTYSLIHDDLPAMDDDDLRRGQPTNHKVFGEAEAILAGDSLLNTAFEIMFRDMFLYFEKKELLNRKIRAAYTIASGAGCRGMIAGQMADIEGEGKACTKEMINFIHQNKTAALISASLKAGAYLGGANDEMVSRLEEFGRYIGHSFQIIDDILDIEGSLELLGKNVGVDVKRKKCSYPSIYGIDGAKEKVEFFNKKALEIISPYYDNADFFKKLVKTLATRQN